MTRVAVAMSGGVDSAVAAALLCDAGDDVIGLTARFWQCDEQTPRRGCCGLDAVVEARAAAGALGIPHYVVDCREEFERLVLRAAWEEYARGRTPNPCVHCNAAIKFGLLLDQARRLGAEHLATGHYATVLTDETGRPALLRGRDGQKDQSYFLFALDEHQLRAALLPLGGLTKDEVRQTARRRGLPNAERPESQDACLDPGEAGFAEALRQRFAAAARPGALIDDAGQQLGEHGGVHRFTVGQRRGLGVALGQRAYVLRIDAMRAEVVVGRDERGLAAPGLLASDVHWLVDLDEGAQRRCAVQIRYRHGAAPATIERTSSTEVRVLFDEPQRAVTPGQAAVLYDGPRVLGGGWIERALS
jgi:tRNA-uridine 2-sulfurtransferase